MRPDGRNGQSLWRAVNVKKCFAEGRKKSKKWATGHCSNNWFISGRNNPKEWGRERGPETGILAD